MVDYPKIKIAKCESDGNLLLYKQSYYMFYYLKVQDSNNVKFLDKAVVQFIAPGKEGEEAVKSYFLLDPGNVREFVKDSLKLYFFFSKQRNELNEFNHVWKVSDIQKEVSKIAIDVLKGVYDEGI